MGRRLEFPESMRLTLAAGTRAEIFRLKRTGQSELDYIRQAISERIARDIETEAEIERRLQERIEREGTDS